MLGVIAAIMAILAVIFCIINGQTAEVSKAILNSSGDAIALCLKIGGIICFFSGLMKVAEKAGITAGLAKLLHPFIKTVIPDAALNKEAEEAVSMNISSNILGLGNAATPFGIKAANLLDKKNDINASRSLAAFVVLNTSSIQLIPSTIIALREANGAAVPFDILPAVIIIQIAAAACGIFFTYLLFNKNK